jgi:hypothetical protein
MEECIKVEGLVEVRGHMEEHIEAGGHIEEHIEVEGTRVKLLLS